MAISQANTLGSPDTDGIDILFEAPVNSMGTPFMGNLFPDFRDIGNTSHNMRFSFAGPNGQFYYSNLENADPIQIHEANEATVRLTFKLIDMLDRSAWTKADLVVRLKKNTTVFFERRYNMENDVLNFTTLEFILTTQEKIDFISLGAQSGFTFQVGLDIGVIE